MIADFFKRLSNPGPDTLHATDCRRALSALMVRLARTDEDYKAVEQAQIDAILARRYALTPEAATELREEAEAIEASAPDTVRFTHAIKEAVPFEERILVIEALWEVVLADGERDDEENAFLRLTANLLGVNDRDSALARQRVEANLA